VNPTPTILLNVLMIESGPAMGVQEKNNPLNENSKSFYSQNYKMVCGEGLSLKNRNFWNERYAREAPDPDYQ
jgi:hypothetical protein